MKSLLLAASMLAAAQAPPPYREEPLTVAHGDVTLAGTLTTPAGSGPFPAVVLISGSGPQNRDENIFGFRVFGVLADHLSQHGIAVYRYDDRGVGGSTGTLAASTTEDSARDALAAIARLKALPGIARDRIGLIGHSEGATAAAIAAAQSRDVAFIVMLAGTSVPGDVVLRQQATDFARALGATDAGVAAIEAAHRAVTDAARTGASAEDQTRAVRALVAAQVEALPAAQQAAVGDRAAYIERAARPAVAQLATPWMKFLLSYDPAIALRRVTVPIYAAFGALDTQVPPSLHEAPLRAAVGAHPRVTIKVYAGANHLFQRARTGQIAEYASLEKAFVPELLDDLVRWILGLER